MTSEHGSEASRYNGTEGLQWFEEGISIDSEGQGSGLDGKS